MASIKTMLKPPSDPHWTIPCVMGDGSTRMIYVKKGANPPELEKRLGRLHRQAAKLLAERTKIDKRMSNSARKAFDQ